MTKQLGFVSTVNTSCNNKVHSVTTFAFLLRVVGQLVIPSSWGLGVFCRVLYVIDR